MTLGEKRKAYLLEKAKRSLTLARQAFYDAQTDSEKYEAGEALNKAYLAKRDAEVMPLRDGMVWFEDRFLSEDFYEKIAPLNEMMPIDYNPKGVYSSGFTDTNRINANE